MEQNNNNPICPNHKGHVEKTKCKPSLQQLQKDEENKLDRSCCLETNNVKKTSIKTGERKFSNEMGKKTKSNENDLSSSSNCGNLDKLPMLTVNIPSVGTDDIIPDPVPGQAPLEMIVDFLRDIMKEDYPNALELANQILHFEPKNETVQEYLPVLKELIRIEEDEDDSTEDEDEETTDSDGEETGESESEAKSGDSESEDENGDTEDADSSSDSELQTVDQKESNDNNNEEEESESESSSSEESSSDSDSDASMISPQDFQIQFNLGQNEEINEQQPEVGLGFGREDDGYNSETESGNSEASSSGTGNSSDDAQGGE